VKTSYQNQLDLMREQLKTKSVDAELERLSKLRDLVGGPPEESDIAKHRLTLADAQSQRAFELERERWKAEWDAKVEDGKSRRQENLFKTITNNVSKALESPVIKELGKTVGKKIGVPDNPVEKIRTTAAQNQLREALRPNPLAAERVFDCPKCHRKSYFSTQQLVGIAENGGRWLCPGCNDVYQLKNDGDDDRKTDGGPNIA
jgi:hypothetical protein